WKDERYWPAFRDALLSQQPALSECDLLKAREFNFQRYYFQGIGRYETPTLHSRAGLPTCRCWPISSPRRAISTGQSQPVSTPASTALSPIYISTILIRRSNDSSQGNKTSCVIVRRFMPR